MLYLVLKIEPRRLDFYGLVKNTAFALPHLVTAPAWPRPAARISSGQVLRIS